MRLCSAVVVLNPNLYNFEGVNKFTLTIERIFILDGKMNWKKEETFSYLFLTLGWKILFAVTSSYLVYEICIYEYLEN